jgi:hypothetical protein
LAQLFAHYLAYLAELAQRVSSYTSAEAMMLITGATDTNGAEIIKLMIGDLRGDASIRPLYPALSARFRSRTLPKRRKACTLDSSIRMVTPGCNIS